MLDDAVKAHKPHPKSLKDEASEEAYNEADARQAFGDKFIDELKLKEDSEKFKGDWWQLALLVKNLEEDEQDPEIKDEARLRAWNKWRGEHILVDSPDYERIHLEHANLRHAHLEHANLRDAHLEHADLSRADLEHADLKQANLNGADVHWAFDLRFDGNPVEGIRIEGNAPDPWSVLRRQYTGPWFFVHLLLLAIFFAPYVGHALYLTAKSQFQEWSREQYNALAQRAPDVPGLSEVHAELQRRFREEHEQRRAVWVLLGLHRGLL
ncbi:MAG: pentapeptide repeat-containing protein, partial [Planctomycetes bacterium]|nr:pentapeptide repeat-containing protein [Planctomycetota bacterium]